MNGENSPTIAEMIYNTPSGGNGNMPIDPNKTAEELMSDSEYAKQLYDYARSIGYRLPSNNLKMETVVAPSPNHSGELTEDDMARLEQEGKVIDSRPIQVSPYPDPYNMVTGIGMQNYMGYPPPQPMYPGYQQYPYPQQGFIPQQQFPTPSGMYMDANQPTMYSNIINPVPGVVRGVQMPLRDYHNPYLGYGTAFGTPQYGYPASYNYMMDYRYMTPQDLQAQREGFANGAEKIMNDMSIYKKLCICAYRGSGSSEEEVEAMLKFRDKEISEAIDKYDAEKKNGSNPINIGDMMKSLEKEEKSIPNLTVRVKKGTEVVGEMESAKSGARSGRIYPSYALDNITRNHYYMMNMRMQQQTYMYNNAVERQLDNMSAIQFFNEGINIVHHRDKEREWYMQAHNSRRLFDEDLFSARLISEYGTPQAQARWARDQARKRRRIEENEKAKEAKSEEAKKKGAKEEDIYRTQDGFCLNKKTGEVWFEMPSEVAAANDERPVVGEASKESYQKKLNENIDLKIDDFLDRHVDSPLRRLQEGTRRIFNPNGSNSLLLAPSKDEDQHYYSAKANYGVDVDTLRKYR